MKVGIMTPLTSLGHGDSSVPVDPIEPGGVSPPVTTRPTLALRESPGPSTPLVLDEDRQVRPNLPRNRF